MPSGNTTRAGRPCGNITWQLPGMAQSWQTVGAEPIHSGCEESGYRISWRSGISRLATFRAPCRIHQPQGEISAAGRGLPLRPASPCNGFTICKGSRIPRGRGSEDPGPNRKDREKTQVVSEHAATHEKVSKRHRPVQKRSEIRGSPLPKRSGLCCVFT